MHIIGETLIFESKSVAYIKPLILNFNSHRNITTIYWVVYTM